MDSFQATNEPTKLKVFSFRENEKSTLESWSAGKGRFFDGEPDTQLHDICFSAYKSHAQMTLDITIRGTFLIQWLYEVIPWDLPITPFRPVELNLNCLYLLPNYPILKSRLNEIEELGECDTQDTNKLKELQLFVRDFLLERSVFESFGFEYLHEQDILTAEHWQDMLHRSVNEELDYLDECVDVALKSEEKLSDGGFRLPDHSRPYLNTVERHDHQARASVLTQQYSCNAISPLKAASEGYMDTNPCGASSYPCLLYPPFHSLTLAPYELGCFSEVSNYDLGVLPEFSFVPELSSLSELSNDELSFGAEPSYYGYYSSPYVSGSHIPRSKNVSLRRPDFSTYVRLYRADKRMPFDAQYERFFKCHHPMSAAIQAQKRLRIGSQLLGKLSESCQRLAYAGEEPSASMDFRSFREQLGGKWDVWRKGLRVLRSLMNGYLPSKLPDVISCLQVADAMRWATPDSTLVCSEQEFINDLERWSMLIAAEEKPLFADITSCLWPTFRVPVVAEPKHYADGETLWHFQKMISNLIHQSAAFGSDQMKSPFGYCPLRSLQQEQFIPPTRASSQCNSVAVEHQPPLPKKNEIWRENSESDISNAEHTEERLYVFTRITVLMAGVIFGAILLYLCLLRYSLSQMLNSIKLNEKQDLDSYRILVRNCRILAVYMGLSIPSFASDKWKGNGNKSPEICLSGEGSAAASPFLSSNEDDSPSNAALTAFSSQSERSVKLATASPSVLSSLLTSLRSLTKFYTPEESINNIQSPYTANSTSTSTSTTSPLASLQCPKCGKSFSKISNRNRHILYDCKFGSKVRFPCRNLGCRRGPQRPFTREAYRNTHEQTSCRAREMR